MFIKLTLHRIKTEWWKIFLLLAFVAFYLWSMISQIPSIKYDIFMRDYGDRSADRVANAFGIEVEGSAEMYDVYQEYISTFREFFYTKPIDNSVTVIILLGLFLAVLMICSLFNNRSVSSMLQSGCSRGSIFISLTATYYLSAIVIWFLATAAVRGYYSVEFLPQERSYFLTTYLSWLIMVLATVSIPYLAAFIFHNAMPTVLVGLGAIVFFRNVLPRHIAPSKVMANNAYWRMDADMNLLLRADIISIGIIVAAVVVAYVFFKRKGQK